MKNLDDMGDSVQREQGTITGTTKNFKQLTVRGGKGKVTESTLTCIVQ